MNGKCKELEQSDHFLYGKNTRPLEPRFQINLEHALEASFENPKQFLRTFTLAPAVCLF